MNWVLIQVLGLLTDEWALFTVEAIILSKTVVLDGSLRLGSADERKSKYRYAESSHIEIKNQNQNAARNFCVQPTYLVLFDFCRYGFFSMFKNSMLTLFYHMWTVSCASAAIVSNRGDSHRADMIPQDFGFNSDHFFVFIDSKFIIH